MVANITSKTGGDVRPGDQEGRARTQAYLWRGVDKTQR